MDEMPVSAASIAEVEESEKSALFEALKQLVLEQVGQVQEIRKKYPLDAIDLVSSHITHNARLDEAHKNELAMLHSRIRILINEIASSIESASYNPTLRSIENMDLGYKEKERSLALINADKRRLVSLRALHLTIEIFNKFNLYIEEEVNRAIDTKNTSNEKKLLLANAMIFYELSDFLIEYIDRFRIEGVEELRKVYEASMADLRSTRDSINSLRNILNDQKVSADEKDKVRAQIGYMEASLRAIEEEWRKIFEEHEYSKSGINQVLELRFDLNSMRARAEGQLKILESISILQLVKNSLGAFQNAFSSLNNIKLIPLDADRVRRLLNIG